ncbi:MAG: ABC transporter ATP-binding protein [Deltaproteobacteria bacterium]|nr:MAG: ABC transporter ATP-binding protein [Deltaproteobacteria bacterium]
MDSELILKGVYFRYNSQWCLEGIDFELKRGEIVGMIGPNGSGKSTLLKIMDGLVKIQRGEILLLNRPLSNYKRGDIARQIAMVPQESTFRFPFSVFEVVLMGRFPHLGPFPFEGKEDEEIARQSMQLTGTLDLATRSIHELSGGEKQRVLIARALTQKAQIILLDEPTSFLDLRHKVEIFELISSLTRTQGLSVIIVSHDISLAAQYCQRMLLLNKGSVYKMGEPAEVITADIISTVYQCPVLVDKNPISKTPRVTVLSKGRVRHFHNSKK